PGYEQAGDYTIHFAATDPGGLSGGADVHLHVANTNRPPTIQVTNHKGLIGQPLTFAVLGTDPDAADHLTFAANGLPAGASLNADTGVFTWTPDPSQAGDVTVLFTVSDGRRTTAEAAVLRISLTPELPQVHVELTVQPGQAVLVHVTASSLVPITGLTLSVGGQPVTLDAQGRGHVVAGTPGRTPIEATATDAEGTVGHASAVLKVLDPANSSAPAVSLDPALGGARLTAAADLHGTVTGGNVDSWVLEQAPQGSNTFTPLASGAGPAAGVLAGFDPATVANGFYRLRLTATDLAGNSASTEVVVEASTAAKPGQYRRAETDLTTSLDGVPISL